MGEKLPLTQVGDDRREKVEIITCASACTRGGVSANLQAYSDRRLLTGKSCLLA